MSTASPWGEPPRPTWDQPQPGNIKVRLKSSCLPGCLGMAVGGILGLVFGVAIVLDDPDVRDSASTPAPTVTRTVTQNAPAQTVTQEVTAPPRTVTVTPTAAPQPFVAPRAETKPSPKAEASRQEAPKKPSGAFYKNCTAARDAGAAPLYVGEPGYRAKLDRDGDGVACE